MINIQVDSRKVKEGDTFVALRGISSDGHSYIDSAIKNGASKIVAEYGNYSVETEIVADTRTYLEEYLHSNYSHIIDEMTIIGITGTNGKTTTAYLMYQALNKAGIKTAYLGTIGFFNKKKIKDLPNTTPEILDIYEAMIESYNKGYKTFVLEASSQGLDARRLETIVFDYAVFTNLTPDHLDYHITMEDYAKAKQKLFENLKLEGMAIVNIDDKYSDYFIINDNKTLTYGKNISDYRITSTKQKKSFNYFNLIIEEEEFSFKTKLIGDFNIYNITPVIAVLKDLGVSNIENIISKIKAPKGRFDHYLIDNKNVIIDYAHTPDAIEKVLETVKKMTDRNIIVVFGCTGERDREKRPVMTNIVLSESKYGIITIDDPYNEDPKNIVDDMLLNNTFTNYEIELDRKKAIKKGFKKLFNNDYLLILGKGHEEYIKQKGELIPFSDHLVVEEIKKEVSK